MRTIFLDTVGLIATWDEDDQWHSLAEPVFLALHQERARLITSSLVLYECGNTAARKSYRNDVHDLRQILFTLGDLIEPTPQELDNAWRAYSLEPAGSAGIVDHVSFIIMRRLAITDAFTNDVHFRRAGFVTLF